MKRLVFGKSISLVLMSALVFGLAMSAEAQRRMPMMDRQETPETREYRTPRMDDRSPGMRHQGMGMMGSGMGMMGGGGMPCPIMNQMGHGMGMAGALDLPDLTEEQQGEIRTIQREVRRQNMEKMMDIMDLRDDMMIEMTAERPDPEQVREIQLNMSQKQGELLESTLESRNRIYDLLTEEQQEQIRNLQRRPGRSPYGQHWTE